MLPVVRFHKRSTLSVVPFHERSMLPIEPGMSTSSYEPDTYKPRVLYQHVLAHIATKAISDGTIEVTQNNNNQRGF